MDFKIFIGIDQTGATEKSGLPKPLNVCIIDARIKKIKIHENLKLRKLSRTEITVLIQNHIANYNNETCLICIDTVFGLPQELNIPIDQIFKDAKDYSFNGKAYGAMTAYHFFNQYHQQSPAILPARHVEKMVGANSVFKMTPYQKNIGCGSYRIIKELSQEKPWYSLWPFQFKKSQFVIAEGYPSYFWKKELQTKTRNLKTLRNIFSGLEVKNLDQADSFVLAYGAYKNHTNITKQKIPKKYKNEGWILGVQYES